MNTSTLIKRAKRTTLLLASGLLMAGLMVGLMVGCDSKKAPEWLFVLTAKHGEIAKKTQGQYVLTLKDQHMQRVLAFTDRPDRLVKEFNVTHLKDMWRHGDDSFKQDPPNAVIVVNGQTQPVVLTGIEVTPTVVKFALEPDGDYAIKAAVGTVAIFIDWSPPIALSSDPYCCLPLCTPIKCRAP